MCYFHIVAVGGNCKTITLRRIRNLTQLCGMSVLKWPTLMIYVTLLQESRLLILPHVPHDEILSKIMALNNIGRDYERLRR